MCRPYEIHAQERLGIAHLLAAPHGLVPDAHPVLVGAHLCAPQPRRAAQDHGVGLLRLLDRDVGALQRAAAKTSPLTPPFPRASLPHRHPAHPDSPPGPLRGTIPRGRFRERAPSGRPPPRLTSSWEPAGCAAAGTYSTSCTSSDGRSEFFPNTTRPPAAAGGSATKVSQDRGGGRAAMLAAGRSGAAPRPAGRPARRPGRPVTSGRAGARSRRVAPRRRHGEVVRQLHVQEGLPPRLQVQHQKGERPSGVPRPRAVRRRSPVLPSSNGRLRSRFQPYLARRCLALPVAALRCWPQSAARSSRHPRCASGGAGSAAAFPACCLSFVCPLRYLASRARSQMLLEVFAYQSYTWLKADFQRAEQMIARGCALQ